MSQDWVSSTGKGLECLSYEQAGAEVTRLLGTKEAVTTSCCCPHSWLSKGSDRGC